MSAIDEAAKAAHEAWYAEKVRRIRELNPYLRDYDLTWKSEAGEEQLVPWDMLSEPVREFDRIVVRAMAPVLLAKVIEAFDNIEYRTIEGVDCPDLWPLERVIDSMRGS